MLSRTLRERDWRRRGGKWGQELFMKWLNKIFRNTLPALINNSLDSSFSIPEPTKSLLWITDEDTSKISEAGSLKITISFSSNTVTRDTEKGDDYYAEPSLIWKKLPVKKNNELEQDPMYYPSYPRLFPKNRYQYLSWLRDITQPTNLSYVFLYYYGLERQLLIGNYNLATQKIY